MRTILPAVACGLLLAACGGDGAPGTDSLSTISSTIDSAAVVRGDTGGAGGNAVTASMLDSAGRDLGVLTLTEVADGIAVQGTLTGLPPGAHAIHIHTAGQCEAPEFTSAGGHWNPTGRKHGSEAADGPHLGDMSNFTVAADSSATIDVKTPGGTLRGTNALLDADGAAVVVHAKADDYRTDPAGDAGPRIACGIVSGR